jgi:hypothetical protein
MRINIQKNTQQTKDYSSLQLPQITTYSKKLLIQSLDLTFIPNKSWRPKKNLTLKTSTTRLKGWQLSVKGRLKGARRARKMQRHFGSTGPNTFNKPSQSNQRVIFTKWGAWNLRTSLSRSTHNDKPLNHSIQKTINKKIHFWPVYYFLQKQVNKRKLEEVTIKLPKHQINILKNLKPL